MIYKPIKSEGSSLPSLLTTHSKDGVESRLSVDESKAPTYNGATINDMRGNPIYDRVDQIDKIGLVEKALTKHAEVFA